MRTDRARRLAALAAAATTALATAAPAQYAADPFFEWTVEESRGIGLEMIAARLMLAEAFEPPYQEELVEQFEVMAEEHFARFGGTLAERDPELAEALAASLEGIAEAAEQQEGVAPDVAGARALLESARALVIPLEALQAPAFHGALLVDLLLAEGGVAEGYEEAVEELWDYPGGWAALQRADLLWAELEPLAAEEARANAEEMMTALHVLFLHPGPPESVLGWNPEEAEAPAQRLAGILEEVVEASLFPGRDFARLASHLAETSDASCGAYAAGEEAVGAESVIAVFDLYDGELAGTASLFAPEEHHQAMELFADLIGVAEDDDEDNAAEKPEREEEEARAEPLPSEDACGNLAETLLAIGRALGG